MVAKESENSAFEANLLRMVHFFEPTAQGLGRQAILHPYIADRNPAPPQKLPRTKAQILHPGARPFS